MGIPLSVNLEPFSLDSKEWKERRFNSKDTKIVNHPEYYFPDGNIIVVVENTAFNLYRGILQKQALIFEDEKEHAFRLQGPITAKDFMILCEFIFPKEIGAVPVVKPGDVDTWHNILRSTIALFMPHVRGYILNKLTEDPTIVAAKAANFLYWIQDEDKSHKELLLQCIRILAYRRSPLSPKEANDLPGTRVNQVALARERVRSLFYNPNYWKVRMSNTLCRAQGHYCSDGVFLAMTKQMSISSKSSISSSEPNLLQIANDSMCEVCRRRYAESVEQNVNLEIRKCLWHNEEEESSSINPPYNTCSWFSRKT